MRVSISSIYVYSTITNTATNYIISTIVNTYTSTCYILSKSSIVLTIVLVVVLTAHLVAFSFLKWCLLVSFSL